MRLSTTFLIILLFVPLSPALGADAPPVPANFPTAKELANQMKAAMEKMTSCQAEVKRSLELPGGYSLKTVARMTMEKSLKDGEAVMKVFLVSKITSKNPDGTERTEEEKVVRDGRFNWSEVRTSDKPEIRVTKRDYRLTTPGFWLHQEIGGLRQLGIEVPAPQVVGEDIIDGRKMYILEYARAVDPAQNDGFKEDRLKYWLGQNDLIPYRIVRTQLPADGGAPMQYSTTEWSRVKINQPVDPSLFTYTPPPGTVILDATRSQK